MGGKAGATAPVAAAMGKDSVVSAFGVPCASCPTSWNWTSVRWRSSARILDELKTERAQAEVDRRRTLSAFADAVGGESFDQARAKEAADLRVATAERLRDAVTRALARIHVLLRNDQRERLAYLIRTGVLAL